MIQNRIHSSNGQPCDINTTPERLSTREHRQVGEVLDETTIAPNLVRLVGKSNTDLLVTLLDDKVNLEMLVQCLQPRLQVIRGWRHQSIPTSRYNILLHIRGTRFLGYNWRS